MDDEDDEFWALALEQTEAAEAAQRRGRAAASVLGLDDLLGAVLAFSDLTTRAAAATSVRFRDGFSRCPPCPKLVRGLVARKYPLLATVIAQDTRPPHVILRDYYLRLFGENPRSPGPPLAPTTNLNDYTISIESTYTSEGTTETIFVGASSISEDGSVIFAVDEDAAIRAFRDVSWDALRNGHLKNGDTCRIRVMASRSGPAGSRQYARLGSGACDALCGNHAEDRDMQFWDLGSMHGSLDSPTTYLEYLEKKGSDRNIYLMPEIVACWWWDYYAGDSAISVYFRWNQSDGYSEDLVNMTPDEICLALEHWATWV